MKDSIVTASEDQARALMKGKATTPDDSGLSATERLAMQLGWQPESRDQTSEAETPRERKRAYRRQIRAIRRAAAEEGLDLDKF